MYLHYNHFSLPRDVLEIGFPITILVVARIFTNHLQRRGETEFQNLAASEIETLISIPGHSNVPFLRVVDYSADSNTPDSSYTELRTIFVEVRDLPDIAKKVGRDKSHCL